MATTKNEKKVVAISEAQPPGNLDFWNSVEQTDPKFTKPVGYGAHKFTAIDAYYQIKNATEQWGSYGKDWGLFNVEYSQIPDSPLMQIFASFNYPIFDDNEKKIVAFPISTAIRLSDNNGKWDADFAKKSETSLITKALSRLGYNSDIFMGKFEDNAYKEQMKEKFEMPDGTVVDIDHTEEQEKKFHELLKAGMPLDFYVFMRSLDIGASVSLNKTHKKGEVVAMKAKVVQLEARGKEDFEQYHMQMIERIIAGDDFGLIELGEEVGEVAKGMIFNLLSNEHQTMAREMFKASE